MPIATSGFGTIINGIGTPIPAEGSVEGTYDGNLICDGDVTITGDIEVKGSMIVRGDLTNSGGYSVTVRGDLHAQSIYFDKEDKTTPQQDFIVDGDLTYAYMEFRQCGGSAATLRVGGDLIGAQGEGGAPIYANGENMSTAGLSIVVNGDMIVGFCDLNGWNSDDTGPGGNGGDVYVYGDLVCQDNFNATGGDGIDHDAGHGGSIEVYGDLNAGYTSVSLYGGSGTNGSGGNGGGLSVNGDVLANELELYGGNCESNSETHRSGSGGDIEIDGNLTVNDYLNANGGDRSGTLTTGGGMDAPNAGYIEVFGNVTIDGDLTANGGDVYTADYAPHNAGRGGDFYCRGSVVCADDFRLYGGYAARGDAGSGGYVEIQGDLRVDDEFEMYGGGADYGTAGAGGEVYIYGHLVAGYINFEGGSGSLGNGGNGGSLNITGDLSSDDYITLRGGDCNSPNETHYSGTGGSIYCKNLHAGDIAIYAQGGNRYGATTVAANNSQPNGGQFYVDGNLHADYVGIYGGSLFQDYPNATGGNGGGMWVAGNAIISGDVEIYGGESRGAPGGDGGYIEVIGNIRCDVLRMYGGAANDSSIGGDASTNGGGGDAYLYGGCVISGVTMYDGQGPGTAPSTDVMLSLNGPCTINYIDMSDRAEVQIRNTTGYPVMLKLNFMDGGKSTFNNIDGSATGDISGDTQASIFYTDSNQTWYKITGSTI